MSDITSDFDPRVLVGKELTRIAFTATNVVMDFEPDMEIDLFGEYIFVEPSGKRHSVNLPPSNGQVLNLISRRLRNAWTKEDELHLEFDDSSQIILFDMSASYELHMPGRQLENLPPDPAIFIGMKLESFSYSQASCTFPFGRSGSLRIEADYSCILIEAGNFDEQTPLYRKLISLAGSTVVAAGIEGMSGFFLKFGGGATLHFVYDDPQQVAPYRIFLGGVTFYARP